jgi:hypothetical protein
LSGCIALPTAEHLVTAPEVHGRVIAVGSKLGIEGARVYFEGRDDIFVLTRQDGSFTLPKQTDLVLLKVFTACPVYDFPTPRSYVGAIVIQKPGWQTKQILLEPYYEKRYKLAMTEESLYMRHEKLKEAIYISDAEIEKANQALEPQPTVVAPPARQEARQP